MTAPRRLVKRRDPVRRPAPPGYVRIIGGAWRGRRIPVLEAEGLRPTADRIRETLFNWLAPMLGGTRCLDLFAGTGALGLEALSRGAREARFVERQPAVAREIELTLQRFKAQGGEVIVADALRFLEGAPQGFDVVFVDPPFTDWDLGKLCTLLEQGWLTGNALIYLEMDRHRALPELPPAWAWHKQKTAGQVRFGLVRANASP